MANLPSNTFLVNYNARDYNPTTKTLPKTSGQLFDEDIVFSGTPYAYDGECIDFSGNGINYTAWYGHDWGGNGADSNPFNRTTTSKSITIIYKTKDFKAYVSNANLIGNRGSNGSHNYMVRPSYLHTSNSLFLRFSPSSNPQYMVIRVNSDGSSERKEVDSSGNTIQSVSASTPNWGGKSSSIGFFSGYGNEANELFTSKFYWMYISNEALTDEEILQVIQYNEGGGSLSLSTDNLTYSESGGSQTVTVTSEENNWSASTNDNWISILPATGDTGDTTVTITVKQALSSKTGTVTFTDGNSTVELTVSQIFNGNIPINKIFYNGTKI